MASGQTCQKLALWQLQFYLKVIKEKYEEIIHWIWVLNKILEVQQHSAEGPRKYTELKDTVKQSKKCQGWNFSKKIEEIELRCNGGSQNDSAGSIIVKAEICKKNKEAYRFYAILRHVHNLIKAKKNEKVSEWRRKSKDKGYVDYKNSAAVLHTEEVEIKPGLLVQINRLQIQLPEENCQDVCALCACCYVGKYPAQTTPLNLNNAKVVKSCKILSEDFQGSVRERIQEDFPKLPKGIYCYKHLPKKKGKEIDSEGKDEIAGINKVAQSFIDLVRDSSNTLNSLVILARYQVDNFLKYVKGMNGYVTKESIDFDIMIVIPQLGILLGEIKAVKDNPRRLLKNICDASVQCQIYKSIFQELFRDKIDMYDIPVHAFIVLPFVSRDSLNFGSNCKGNLSHCLFSSILTSEDMENLQSFTSWIKRIHGGTINISDKWVMSEHQYWTVLERFVGFGSNTKIVSYTKLINDIGDRCFHVDLTDDQRVLVNQKDPGYRYLTLAGDYGTGKSLILVKKAINIAREICEKKDQKGKVVIVACGDICMDGEYLDRKFPEHTIHHLQKLCHGYYAKVISVKTFKSFTKANSPDLSGIKGVELLMNAVSHLGKEYGSELHLMLDEVPANFVEKLQSSECQDIFAKCVQSVKTLWLVVGSHSYRVWRNSSTGGCVKNCKPSPDFKHWYLDKVLRSPKNVFRVSEEISRHCGDDHQGHLRNDCYGPKPMLLKVPKCGCEECRVLSRHTSPESNPLKHACMEERLTLAFKAIFKEIGIFDGNKVLEDADKWPGKVTVLTFGVEDGDLLRDLHSLLIKCCKNIPGLNFRDTIMGDSRENVGNIRNGQGDQSASAWGCLGDRSESDEFLNESDVVSRGLVATAVVECQCDSSASHDHRNCMEGCNCDSEVNGSEVYGSQSDISISSLWGNSDTDSEEDAMSSLDSENSSGDSDAPLGIIGKTMAGMADDEPSGSPLSCMGSRKTGSVQERPDQGENASMDINNGSDGPKILLTRTSYFVGCESHVVICIDLNAMKHWFENTKVAYSTLAVSRCLAQYIHLTWNEEEADIMFKMNVKALSEDLGDDFNEDSENGEKQSILEKLLDNEVMTEKFLYTN